uniref:Putative trypsin-like serine protease n=1 Tax=Corethrella appendiculata TaxID=1370023 RepID=U5ELY5_9DIPT
MNLLQFKFKYFLLLLFIYCAQNISGQTEFDTGLDIDAGCGERKIKHKGLVANGFPSREGDWPWHVGIFHLNNKNQWKYRCGGTIINPYSVLTAGHCVVNDNRKNDAENLKVYLGKYYLNGEQSYTEEVTISLIKLHEKYHFTTLTNDIAILRLSREITFNDYIQPACLWREEFTENRNIRRTGTVIGWGLNENEQLSEVLTQAEMPIVDTAQCRESDPVFFHSYLTDKVFCAGYKNGTAVCNGDSGGGLFLNIDDEYYVRGIVSLSKNKKDTTDICDPKEYVIFTDVAQYLDWITVNLERKKQIPIQDHPNLKLLKPKYCGTNLNGHRMPEEAKPIFHQYPWIGLLEYYFATENSTRVLCIGTLINSRYLVTAAHCVIYLPVSYDLQSVRFNEFNTENEVDCDPANKNDCTSRTETIKIQSILIHPQFNKPKYTNDIALLRLERPTTMEPICMPLTDSQMNKVLNQFTRVGWRKSGLNHEIMQREPAKVLDSQICKGKLQEFDVPFDKYDRQICIENQKSEGNCTYLMAGTPLQTVLSTGFFEKYFLFGLSSFGPVKCGDDYPDVYTSTRHYINWILNTISE